MDNPAMKDAFAKKKVDPSDYPDPVAKIDKKDAQISGGRVIVQKKSNGLFTGQFDESDLKAFVDIWRDYLGDTRKIRNIKASLMRPADAMIQNYRGEVCPIELMLYTSNVAASSFRNLRLISEVADAVCLVLQRNEKYLQSVKHILEVWNWEQAINVCSIAVGKFVAERDNAEALELLHYIYDNFHYQEVVNYGCFRALMESKKDEFVVDILNMIHDLVGTDDDKQIGKFFKRNFNSYFPNYCDRLDSNMFKDANDYVQSLIGQMTVDTTRRLFDRYQQALSQKEQKNLVGIALDRIINDDKSGSPYDAVKVLKSATNEAISERLFTNLNLGAPRRQRPRASILAVICSYFGKVNYPPAMQAFEKILPDDDYYAAVRIALFFQGRISSDTVVEDFLTETRPDRIKAYLSGFYVLDDKLRAVRNSTISYMARVEDDKLSTAITNYLQLIKQDRRIYDPQIGSMIKTWFGYETTLSSVPLRIQDQMACMNIIGTIINERNSNTYEEFLFQVAEQPYGFSFSVSPAVSNSARGILKTLRVKKIDG